MAAEAALANAQSSTRLVLNADGARVDWGRGQFYTAKLAHLRFRRIFLAVFQIGAMRLKTRLYGMLMTKGALCPGHT